MIGGGAMRLAGATKRSAAYRYYVLHITASNSSGGGTGVQTFSLLVDGVYVPTTMTGPSTPAPYVVSASYVHSTTTDAAAPYNAFDGLETLGGYVTRWYGGAVPTWLAIDMGSPVLATGWRLVPQLAAANYSPRDFTIRGSNTSPTEGLVILASVTGYTGSPTSITGTFS